TSNQGKGNKGSGGNSTSSAKGYSGSNTGNLPGTDGGTVSGSAVKGDGTKTLVVTEKDKKGNTIEITVSDDNKKGYSASGDMSLTPYHDTGKGRKNTPGDDDTSYVGQQIDPNSSVAKIGQGGGTDNNTETNTTQGSQLAPNSALTRKGQGDGDDGRGDNSTVGN